MFNCFKKTFLIFLCFCILPSAYAVENQNLDMVRFLSQYETNVNASDKDGNTPLSMAIKTDNLEAIKILCNARASLILDNGTTIFDLLLGKPEIYYTTVIIHARFNQEVLDKTTKCIELLLALKEFYIPEEICLAKKKLYIPEEICLANLKELYIKLYLADLQEDYNKLYPPATLQELYDKLYSPDTLGKLYRDLTDLKSLTSKDKDFALKQLCYDLPALEQLNIPKLMLVNQTFNNFTKQTFDNFLQKKFDDFVKQKFSDFVKELYKEIDIITYRNPIFTQVYKCIIQLKKILQMQDDQNQTALQLLLVNYSHNPEYLKGIEPLLNGTKLDADFNELKHVLTEISNSEKTKKLDSAELIPLLDAKLDQNNLALQMYKNCALLESEPLIDKSCF